MLRTVAQKTNVLAQSAVPVVLPSSGSSNATGQITLTTALAYQPSGTVGLYLPTGVVTAGSQGTGAAVYQVVFSSTSVCQIQGTGIVTANGAYTQTTAVNLVLASIIVPGGAMGANGGLRVYSSITVNNTVNSKLPVILFGGLTAFSPLTIASATAGGAFVMVRNRGVQNAQMWGELRGAVASVITSMTSINTSVNQSLQIAVQMATATDYAILEMYTIEIFPT